MGRGGPEEPEIVRGDQIEITPTYLMEQSDKVFTQHQITGKMP
jgi:cyclic 2,3-diphosphoglycerate synthetase